MYLVGDIGGTKTLLALTTAGEHRPELSNICSFPSDPEANLVDILTEYLGDNIQNIKAICLGVAGPIVNNRCEATNLSWKISGKQLSETFRVPVRLLNDLEALGHAIEHLNEDEILEINPGKKRDGNRALIAAGTGLGQSILFWDGHKHIVSASEGGHCDFAPRNDLQIEVLRHLIDLHGHVSTERIVSGLGIITIYAALRALGFEGSEDVYNQILETKKAFPISKADQEGRCERSTKTLDFFLEAYGAETGNLALKAMAHGGIYIGGGIAPKLLERLQDGIFMAAYLDKGRFQENVEDMPVRVILNDQAALLGSAAVARTLSR